VLGLIQVENASGIITQIRQGYTLLGTANGFGEKKIFNLKQFESS